MLGTTMNIEMPVVDYDDGETDIIMDAPPPPQAKHVDEDEVSIIQCDTSAGKFTLRLERRWSPHGYDRAVELFRRKYYDNSHFYRVTDYLVQFGIGYTQSDELWQLAHDVKIPDDPMLDPPIPFREGTIAFASKGKNSRRSELFIVLDNDEETIEKFGNNRNPWETPIGTVVDGMSALSNLYRGYGELKPLNENGPDAFKIKHVGRSYVEANFPLMDHFRQCSVKQEEAKEPKHNNKNEDEMRYGRATMELRKLSAAMTMTLAEGGYGMTHSVSGEDVPIATKKISAYRDHHDNIQGMEGSGYSVVVAFLLVCFLLYLSHAMSKLNGTRARGVRSKAL